MTERTNVEKAVHNKLKGRVTIKCPECGYVVGNGDPLKVRGIAERDDGRWVRASGYVVWHYQGPYRFEGIHWDRLDVGSSSGEKAQCTECGKWSPLAAWGFYELDERP